jgi:hypothetical protein
VAVTYGTSRGGIVRAGSLRLGITYRVRYEIDMSDHRDEVVWSLPSKDERRFNATIGVGWHVFDPCVVTLRRVTDGFEVIKGYLLPVVRRLSREYTIEQLHALEDQINQLVAGSPARFTEGLEVFHVHAELIEDEQTVDHAATVRGLDRKVVVAEKQHIADYSAARSQIDIDRLRRTAIEKMVSGENGLLLTHLATHREDTMGVLQALQQQDQISAQARAQLLEQFQHQLLPEELSDLAKSLIRQMQEAIERPSVPQIGQPHVPPAIVAGTSEPSPAPALPPAAGPLRSTPNPPASAEERAEPANTPQRPDDESRPQLPRDSGVKW